MLQPGQTLGIVGGGQLGRMLARETRRLGFRAVVFTNEYPPSPAGQLADREINAHYFDPEATSSFIKEIDVATVEFENIPLDFLEALEQRVPVFPTRHALAICQNREREKNFLQSHGIPHAEFAVADSAASLKAATGRVGFPCILKTAAFGYDGKGQIKLTAEHDLERIWTEFGAPRGVVERLIDFECEISVVAARTREGEFAAFPVCENIHRNHVLDLTIVPARVAAPIAERAESLAESVATALDYVGTLAVEMFVTRDGEILVNEIAPRPHNSGHFTIDACATNQFEQQLRCAAGMKLGSTTLHTPVVMANLLGHLWPSATKQPDWTPVLNSPDTKLHLYGKRLAKRGRKMGHFCVLAPDVETALQRAKALKAALGDT